MLYVITSVYKKFKNLARLLSVDINIITIQWILSKLSFWLSQFKIDFSINKKYESYSLYQLKTSLINRTVNDSKGDK